MSDVPTTHTVLYDGDCSLCTFQSRVISWLDWTNSFTLLPIADPRAAEIAPGIGREDLMEAIHCVAKDGQIHRGARCIRFVSLRMPLAVPAGLFLWIPGVIQIAEIAYRWLSRNRHLISRIFGCKGACTLLPARQNHQSGSSS